MAGRPAKQLLQHRLYSWADLGESHRKQIVRGGLPDDITQLRYFMHMGVLFDSTHFTLTPDDTWFTDGGPVHIRYKSRNSPMLDVAIKLFGRIVQVRAVVTGEPEPYAGKKVGLIPDPSLIGEKHGEEATGLGRPQAEVRRTG
jgi:hypothetical protein